MTELNIKIEELIQNNAPDFQIAKVIKNEIKDYLGSLDEIFIESSGKDFFVKHTKKIDGFIIIIYKYLLRKHFGSYLPMSNSIPLTIIALGSYGREELCVYSDIDIMILYDQVSGYNLKPIMEEFMTLAWDSGLKLGSRAHEAKEIEEAVNTDVTIKTSILESRLIYGSKHLWFKYQNSLTNIRNHKQKEFVLEKLEEHKIRLEKNPLNMQANIKDGYGGMRESNMLFWMANVTYGVSDVKYLSNKLCNEEEYKKYRSALEYIFKVRNALHLCAKKKLDIVTFDILPDISDKLGFKDTPRMVKEYQCMSKVFESLHTIHMFTTAVIRRITRRHLANMKNLQNVYSHRIDKNLYLFNNKLYTTFSNKPKKLNMFLKELIHLPNYINSFDISYVNYSSKTIMPIKVNNTTKKLIVSLLQKENLYSIIDMLISAEILVDIIPIFKKLINQPQFDGYHKHPTDIHSIRTLYYIENIKDDFLEFMYNKLSTKQRFMLKLAALFHDVGKGRGKDHHVVGQNLFRKFARSLELEEDIINTVSTLIRYHNMMTKVATTEDIYSQNTILSFSGIIPTKEMLELLFILTYADISSVDSKLYKSSTSSLLRELYLQTLPAYENKELLTVSKRRAAKENTIKNNKTFLCLTKSLQKKILNIESNQLFLKYSAKDIIDFSLVANDVNKYEYKIRNKDKLLIRIMRFDPLNLGFLLGKLQFLNISSMGIYKLFDEKKFFEIGFDENINDDEIPFIENIIKDSFDMSKTIKLKKPNISHDEIIINCNHTEELAQMKIQTKDQKGMFSYIAKTFDEYGIEINSAKIQSHNGKANDMLLIAKNGNFCNNKEEIISSLTQD